MTFPPNWNARHVREYKWILRKWMKLMEQIRSGYASR